MTVWVLVLLLYPCFVLAAMNSAAGPSAESDTQLERAAKEFKTETESLGIRPEQVNSQAGPAARKLAWHGRVFENFRNDVLDAVPHQIKQRGEDKSLLQRNQFGFNVSGPFIIPKILPARSNTFFSLSYEGVRERITHTYLGQRRRSLNGWAISRKPWISRGIRCPFTTQQPRVRIRTSILARTSHD